MHRLLILLTVLVVLYTPSKASASGNWLLNICESNNPTNLGMCIGFIAGAAHGMEFGGISVADPAKRRSPTYPMYCIPESVTNVQLRDIVIRFLRQHPEQRHVWYIQLVADAMWASFPCRPR
jgi:hypothetical protein